MLSRYDNVYTFCNPIFLLRNLLSSYRGYASGKHKIVSLHESVVIWLTLLSWFDVHRMITGTVYYGIRNIFMSLLIRKVPVEYTVYTYDIDVYILYQWF